MTGAPGPFAARLAQAGPILLDGATGTELTRRGVDTTLPLWSSCALLEAPEVLRQIHLDHRRAGAEIITAATFRTHARNLAPAGLAARAQELTEQAVRLAREGAGGGGLVAGSLAPLEDCYAPELTPDDRSLTREHSQQARALAEAGVDLILAETHGTVREAVAATRAGVATGRPTLVGFVCDRGGRLLGGESLHEAVAGVLPHGPAMVLCNCSAAGDMREILVQLREAAGDLPLGVYANIGHADPDCGWVNTEAQDPVAYALLAREWLTQGVRLLGGCCGTTPAHTEELRRLLDDQPGPSSPTG